MSKNVVITGSNRGIGMSILEKYAENACNIWACTRKKNLEFEFKIKELEERYNVWIKPIYFDLNNSDEIEKAMKSILEEKLPIDVLINNAGINSYSLFQMTNIVDARNLFEVDFFAPYLIMQFVLKKMIRQKSGSIINVASIAALDAHSGDSVYGAAKAALLTMSKSIACEVGKYNIRVNVVAPGPTDSDMIKINREKIGESLVQNSIMGRLGKKEEIANVIYFLSSDESSFINGQVIRVDGGIK